MLDKLVIATANPGKFREFASLLSGVAAEVAPLPEGVQLPEETGLTFAENARLKAAAAAKSTGLPCLADDSGLAVDALGGEPGVRSARYAGEGATDADRREKVLRELENRPDAPRTARFVAALSLVLPDGGMWEAAGVCEGIVVSADAGDKGFGYDPIFFYPPLGRTFGELSAEEKNAVSHRARAVSALLASLREHPEPPFSGR